MLVVMGSAPWWGTALLEQTGYFALRRVQVEGAKYLAPEAVAEALALGPGASVFEDLDELTERVRRMPGIESAEVTRRLPGTLRVTVHEIEPVALAEGPNGLVALGPNGQPLPYDPVRARVDGPLVRDADPRLVAALLVVQRTDPGLFAAVASARAEGGGMALDLNAGRIRLDLPVNPDVVLAVAAVRRDLGARPWRELDGRYRGWVVVRRPST